jgi:ATP-dependent RNA helicase RhlE
VLDEADRMLDMGFIHDIKKIIAALPKQRQTLLFSATIPEDIIKLSASLLHDPVTVHANTVSSSSVLVNQSVFHVNKEHKRRLLSHVLSNKTVDHALVFTRTKRGADRVAKELTKQGILAAAIHGDKSQSAREKALSNFKTHKLKVLVATDIASRGIDVAGISHVINFEIPEMAETYVHRIGRTGRAGVEGNAWSFCSDDERTYLRDIQKLIQMHLPVVNHPFEQETNK